ncbi:MAG: carboxylating nicotinate-nucleotide diphosphorylase [Flavobacteriales bacterium]|nr:carboxylating nicotinate-nucleotide diphosphorylase [Flavobacteriales bacterium]
MDFYSEEISTFIKNSLAEDVGNGDHSSNASIPAGTVGNARLICKENGILAGILLAERIFHHIDPELEIDFLKKDGDRVNYGEDALKVRGSVHSILMAERLMLNCIQRLSGIATTTRKVVDTIIGCNTKILDTRKTTPGIRMLEKWAVTVGGGYNHRFGLYDMIMLKDNHIDYAGGITKAVDRTLEYIKKNHLELSIEVETRNLEEVAEALKHTAVDRIMLDNFDPENIRKALNLISGKKETEASGGITLENVRSYAETGVDYISIGALTHSVKSLDFSLKEF